MILLYHTVNIEESLIPSEVGDVIIPSNHECTFHAPGNHFGSMQTLTALTQAKTLNKLWNPIDPRLLP